MTLRIGDVYIGPRGGRREVLGFEWTGEAEQQAREWGAPYPEAWRAVCVYARGKRWVGWFAWTAWLATATKTVEGTGEAAPWE